MKGIRGVLIGTMSLLAGCQHKPAAGESVDEVCQLANNGHDGAVSGYLVAPFLTIGCEHSCEIYVGRTKHDRDGVQLSFKVGNGPREMAAIRTGAGRAGGTAIDFEVVELSPNAYQLNDDARHPLGLGDVVRVTGKLRVTQRDGRIQCEMQATSVVEL
jgi:hypothetical protein